MLAPAEMSIIIETSTFGPARAVTAEHVTAHRLSEEGGTPVKADQGRTAQFIPDGFLCVLLSFDGSGRGDPEGGAKYLLLQLVEDADWRPWTMTAFCFPSVSWPGARGGRRLYDAACVARLELVVTLRELGLGLPEVRRVLAGQASSAARCWPSWRP